MIILLLISITFYTIKFIFFHSLDACFANIFDSFNPAMMLKRLRLKSCVSFGTNILLDRSVGALQLPTHLSKLSAHG